MTWAKAEKNKVYEYKYTKEDNPFIIFPRVGKKRKLFTFTKKHLTNHKEKCIICNAELHGKICTRCGYRVGTPLPKIVDQPIEEPIEESITKSIVDRPQENLPAQNFQWWKIISFAIPIFLYIIITIMYL